MGERQNIVRPLFRVFASDCEGSEERRPASRGTAGLESSLEFLSAKAGRKAMGQPEFSEWKEEGLRACRRFVNGAAYVLRLSHHEPPGGPNVEAARKALALLEATENKEEWFGHIEGFNDTLEKLNNELQYRFAMDLYEAAGRYGWARAGTLPNPEPADIRLETEARTIREEE